MAHYRNQSLERGFGILEYLGTATVGQSVMEVCNRGHWTESPPVGRAYRLAER